LTTSESNVGSSVYNQTFSERQSFEYFNGMRQSNSSYNSFHWGSTGK